MIYVKKNIDNENWFITNQYSSNLLIYLNGYKNSKFLTSFSFSSFPNLTLNILWNGQ